MIKSHLFYGSNFRYAFVPLSKIKRYITYKISKLQTKSEINKSEKISVLSTVRDFIMIVAIYLYFTGWIFVYYQFREFGISLPSVDIPVYYFFLYSYTVISENLLWFILPLALLLALAHTSNKIAKILGIVIISAGFFPVCFYLAKKSGEGESLRLRSGDAKNITLIFKESALASLSDKSLKLHDLEYLLDENFQKPLKLLTQTNQSYFVFFQPPPDSGSSLLPRCYVYEINKSDIYLSRIKLPNVKVQVTNNAK